MVDSTADPFAAWREWMSQSERQWNAFLNQAMATDEFSQSLGKFMDVYVGMQKSMNEGMSRYLSAINVPSREDVLDLGHRLGAIEERLGRIESALAGAREDGKAGVPEGSAKARPPRTKRPAGKS